MCDDCVRWTRTSTKELLPSFPQIDQLEFWGDLLDENTQATRKRMRKRQQERPNTNKKNAEDDERHKGTKERDELNKLLASLVPGKIHQAFHMSFVHLDHCDARGNRENSLDCEIGSGDQKNLCLQGTGGVGPDVNT